MKQKSSILDDIKWATCVPLIGGSAIGCTQTIGHKPEYHISYSPFSYNEKQICNYWPEVPHFVIDSPEFNESDIPETKIDFVNAVCPCAGLSMLNHHSSPDSKTNDWMYESTEYVLSKIQPKVLWGENAPALATSKGRPVALRIAEIGRKYGYSFSMMKTNAMEHGLPQNRQRTFYFLWKSTTAPIIGYRSRKSISLTKYLSLIPENATQQDLFYRKDDPLNNLEVQYCLNKTNLLLDSYIKHYKRGSFCLDALKIANGPNNLIHWLEEQPDTQQRNRLIKFYKHVADKAKDGKGFMDSSIGYAYDRMNAWVGRTPINLLSPFGTRFYNVREMLHIMGLPHDFELQDWQNNLNTVCQNVPVPTTRDFVKEVVRFCLNDKSLVYAPANFVVQNNCNRCIEETKMIW